MAATYHTTHLGLSLWAQTDCPQWVDFLKDNQKLDQKVGGHIYGCSITDPCLGWEDTEKLLYTIAELC